MEVSYDQYYLDIIDEVEFSSRFDSGNLNRAELYFIFLCLSFKFSIGWIRITSDFG